MEIAGDGRFGGKHDKKLIRAVFFSNFLDIHSVALTSEFRNFFRFACQLAKHAGILDENALCAVAPC